MNDTIFGRLRPDGLVTVLHNDGSPVTRIDAALFPVRGWEIGSGQRRVVYKTKAEAIVAAWRYTMLDPDGEPRVVHEGTSTRYEWPDGIVLTRADAESIDLEIEEGAA